MLLSHNCDRLLSYFDCLARIVVLFKKPIYNSKLLRCYCTLQGAKSSARFCGMRCLCLRLVLYKSIGSDF